MVAVNMMGWTDEKLERGDHLGGDYNTLSGDKYEYKNGLSMKTP